MRPNSGDTSACRAGSNHNNRYPCQTPCDPDFLCKFTRDADSERLHSWFNAPLPRRLRRLKRQPYQLLENARGP